MDQPLGNQHYHKIYSVSLSLLISAPGNSGYYDTTHKNVGMVFIWGQSATYTVVSQRMVSIFILQHLVYTFTVFPRPVNNQNLSYKEYKQEHMHLRQTKNRKVLLLQSRTILEKLKSYMTDIKIKNSEELTFSVMPQHFGQ